MPGSHDEVARDAPDWENMTNKALHDKFAQMMSEQVQDIENRFTDAIDGVEKMIDTKLDAKFTELIARIPTQPTTAPARPPPPRRARRILLAIAATLSSSFVSSDQAKTALETQLSSIIHLIFAISRLQFLVLACSFDCLPELDLRGQLDRASAGSITFRSWFSDR